MLAVVTLLAASEAFYTMPLKKRELPDRTFIAGPTENCACADCRFMKCNTLEKLRDALATLQPEIILPEAIRARAEAPIRRMLEQSA